MYAVFFLAFHPIAGCKCKNLITDAYKLWFVPNKITNMCNEMLYLFHVTVSVYENIFLLLPLYKPVTIFSRF